MRCIQNTHIEHLFYWFSENSLLKSLGFITYTRPNDSFRAIFVVKRNTWWNKLRKNTNKSWQECWVSYNVFVNVTKASDMLNADTVEIIFSSPETCLPTTKQTVTLQMCTTLRSETFATIRELQKLWNFRISQT